MLLRCYHCHTIKGNSLEELVQHSKRTHPDLLLSVLQSFEQDGRIKFRAHHYNITPKQFLESLQSMEDRVSQSPLAKGAKFSTPQKCVEHHPLCDAQVQTFESELAFEKSGSEADYYANLGAMLEQHLPNGMKAIKRSGQYEDWLLFTKMLMGGTFPTDNISYRLFLDVLHFYSTTNIHAVRYCDSTKKFWSLGFRLFKGRFLRFMGGIKSISSNKHESKPSDSRVNFIVPGADTLRKDIDSADSCCQNPGIIFKNIESFTQSSETSNKSHKLCFDGKKLCQGFGKNLGEVNLFGFETNPTLEEKQQRLTTEQSVIKRAQDIMCAIDSKGHVLVQNAIDSDKIVLQNACTQIITILSTRVKDLRTGLVKKELAIENLLKVAGSAWQTSKLAYAISGTKTAIHRMKACISDILQCIDRIGRLLACINGRSHLHHIGSGAINLTYQCNHKAIEDPVRKDIEMPTMMSNDMSTTSIHVHHIKQRTPEWHSIRDQAKVTGSTLHTAIGLR